MKETLKIDRTNWTRVTFGDVVFEPKENAKDIYNEGIEHVVGLEHIDSENIHLTRSGILEETTTFSKKFRKGDVLFGRRRAYLKKAALAGFDGICSGDITVFRAKKNLLPELLPFIVNNEKFFDYAIKHSAGGLSPRVKFKDLANYEFLLPPKDQQAQLAELLWAMDEVIEREREVLERLDKAMKSSIKYHFSNANNVIRIKDLGKVITGATPPTNNVNYWQGGITPFITPSEIDDSIYVNKTERFLTESGVAKSRLFKANSVLTVCIGSTIGKIAINEIESCSNQQINAIIPQDGYSAIYILHLLRYHKSKILARSGATAVPIINKTEFESIKLPILQKSKIPIFENEVIGFSKSIKLMESKINSSQTLQKSLINQIF